MPVGLQKSNTVADAAWELRKSSLDIFGSWHHRLDGYKQLRNSQGTSNLRLPQEAQKPTQVAWFFFENVTMNLSYIYWKGSH